MASSSILGILQQAAASFGIPAPLFTAQAQQESSLNPNAYNPKSGATGLLQLEPATAAQYGVTGAALLDPAQNASAGANYLADLYQQFGDWATALAAYDWGPGNVEAAQAAYGPNWLAAAPAETQNYVSSILASAGLSQPAAAAAQPAAVPNAPAEIPWDTIVSPEIDELFPPAPAGAAEGPNFLLLLLIGAGVYFGATWLAEEFS